MTQKTPRSPGFAGLIRTALSRRLTNPPLLAHFPGNPAVFGSSELVTECLPTDLFKGNKELRASLRDIRDRLEALELSLGLAREPIEAGPPRP